MARVAARQLVKLFAALVVAAPLVFGPAFSWALTTLGAVNEHTCACGMRQGECGCPECARLTAQKKSDDAPKPYRTFKRTCDDDAPTAAAASLPIATPPLAALTLPPCPVARALPTPEAVVRTRDRAAPPSPPPRAARV